MIFVAYGKNHQAAVSLSCLMDEHVAMAVNICQLLPVLHDHFPHQRRSLSYEKFYMEEATVIL